MATVGAILGASVGVLMFSVVLAAASVFGQRIAQHASDPSFVHVFSDGVWFLQWTDSNGTLAGQLQSVAVQPNLTLNSSNQVLSGVRSGVDVTLRLGGFFASAAYTGTLRGSTLVLNIPLQNGGMETVVFQPGTVEDYNRAVAALRARIDEMIRLRQRAADLAARQHAVVLANERMRGTILAVQSATTRLETDTDFGSVLKQLSKDWTRIQRDYSQLQADAAKQPLTCPQLNGIVKADLQGVLAADLQGSLAADNQGVFAPRQGTILQDISQLTAAIQEMRQSFAALQQAAKQNVLGTPGPAYTEAQVQAVAAMAYQQVRESNDAVWKAQAQKDHILSSAQALFDKAKDFVGNLTCVQ